MQKKVTEMNCEKIQNLLMADYIDGEANEKTCEKIREHLAACRKCKELEEALKKNVIDPLKTAGRERPPDFLWERIKSRIIKERETVSRRAGIKILKPAFAVPAAALAILALVIITRIPLKGNGRLDSYMEEQVDFIMTIDDNGTAANGLGTSIEEYLLS